MSVDESAYVRLLEDSNLTLDPTRTSFSAGLEQLNDVSMLSVDKDPDWVVCRVEIEENPVMKSQRPRHVV